MDSYIINQILNSIGDGNIIKAGAWIAVFVVIWLEVRGMKKQLRHLNETISKSFAQGEKRFESIENDVHQIRLDIDKNKGVNHGNLKQANIT